MWAAIILLAIAALIRFGTQSKTLPIVGEMSGAANEPVISEGVPEMLAPAVPVPGESAVTPPDIRYELLASTSITPVNVVPTLVPGAHKQYTLAALPSFGWIQQPIITAEWIESYRIHCKSVARLAVYECATRLGLLERFLQGPADLSDPWVTLMQGELVNALLQLSWSRDLLAYNATCGREGCLLFLAMDASTDWQKVTDELVKQFLAPRWTGTVFLRDEGQFGGPYADGSGQWQVAFFERLGPRMVIPEEAAPAP